MKIINYTPPGTVAAAYLRDRSRESAIMGPVGSAKTTTTISKLIAICAEQEPYQGDGIARVPVVAVRDTYRQLYRTTIRDFRAVVDPSFPPNTEANEWTGGQDQPGKSVIRFRAGAKRCELITYFLAVGDQRIEDVFRGFGFYVGWLNEADLCNPLIRDFMLTRLGRDPDKLHRPVEPTYMGILYDYNAPDVDNYLYHLSEEDRPDDFAFFRQPGGRDPYAENLENLPKDYYENQVKSLKTSRPWLVRRMVDNQYGYSRDGMPVFSEFNDDRHVSAERLVPAPERKIILGLDAGRTPACQPMQIIPTGQLRWYQCLAIDKEASCGAEEFGRRLLAFLAEEFPGGYEYALAPDPSAFYAHDTGEMAWAEIVSARTAIPLYQGSEDMTNDPGARCEAIRVLLNRDIGGVPSFLLCRTNRIVRKAMNSDYRFRRITRHGQERYDNVPDKTQHCSHVMDAGQHGTVCITGIGTRLLRENHQAEQAEKALAETQVYDPLRDIGAGW